MSKNSSKEREELIKEAKQNCSKEQLRQATQAAVSRDYLTPSRVASSAISSVVQNVEIVDSTFGLDGIIGLDEKTLQEELVKQNEALFSGDMKRIEAMLLDQAHTLQVIFTHSTQRMANAEILDHLEAFGRLALKAQNQCRQTLATLGELKNPKRATFIKQQNNAVNQQIKQAENSKKTDEESNELLEVIPSERLDTRAPQAAIGTDQEMETVGTINRTEDENRETES